MLASPRRSCSRPTAWSVATRRGEAIARNCGSLALRCLMTVPKQCTRQNNRKSAVCFIFTGFQMTLHQHSSSLAGHDMAAACLNRCLMRRYRQVPQRCTVSLPEHGSEDCKPSRFTRLYAEWPSPSAHCFCTPAPMPLVSSCAKIGMAWADVSLLLQKLMCAPLVMRLWGHHLQTICVLFLYFMQASRSPSVLLQGLSPLSKPLSCTMERSVWAAHRCFIQVSLWMRCRDLRTALNVWEL